MISEETGLIHTKSDSKMSYFQTVGTGIASAAASTLGGYVMNHLLKEQIACLPEAKAVLYSGLAVLGFLTGCASDYGFSKTSSKAIRSIKALSLATIPQALILLGLYGSFTEGRKMACDKTPATGGFVLLIDTFGLMPSAVVGGFVAKEIHWCQGPHNLLE